MSAENGSMFQYKFDQLARYESGRTPILLNEEEYCRAQACVNACAGIPTDQLSNALADIATLDQEARQMRARIARLESNNRELLSAAQHVVDRWKTPLWKDVPHTAEFINALEAVIKRVQP